MLAGLWMMRLHEAKPTVVVARMVRDLVEGARYAFGSRPIRAILLLVAVVSLVGTPYSALLPIFAVRNLQGGAGMLGLLTAAAGVGALAGALYMAARKTVRGLGRVIAAGPAAFGAGLIVFAFSTTVWLSLPALAVIGFAIMVQMASSNTILQTIVEEDKRGRVMSFYATAFLGLAPVAGGRPAGGGDRASPWAGGARPDRFPRPLSHRGVGDGGRRRRGVHPRGGRLRLAAGGHPRTHPADLPAHRHPAGGGPAASRRPATRGRASSPPWRRTGSRRKGFNWSEKSVSRRRGKKGFRSPASRRVYPAGTSPAARQVGWGNPVWRRPRAGYASRTPDGADRRGLRRPSHVQEVPRWTNVCTKLEQAASLSGLLGWLNFSDGRPDPRWQKQLNDAYAFLAEQRRGRARGKRCSTR